VGRALKIGETNCWREAQRPAKFMFLDARIVLFAALALLHFRIWTLALLGAAAAVLFILERRKIDPSSLPRMVGSCLGGPDVRARPPAEERESVDYAFELNDRNWKQLEGSAAPASRRSRKNGGTQTPPETPNPGETRTRETVPTQKDGPNPPYPSAPLWQTP